ncbi:AraC family transcriptional regulator [Arthrobacter glacialis]|uniref:DNA-binding protein n=1 Tax=Arthrobacter glacialis TaxID=1664 RepID=A0A2S4A020_ARTGL|nr:helix-turn-helix domain-containing protein [Arthrobacter glacialis]POH74512.1 DNA-binding protein [Arthrobacter glacialis]
MANPFKGILYPTRLPTFHRLPAPDSVKDLVQWFWIPEWDIEPGRSSRQQLIAFAASNLVVQPHAVEFSGPTTRTSHRDLTGHGWAVGALLRPAAIPAFTTDPAALRDREVALSLPALQSAVVAAMGGADPAQRRNDAVEEFTAWLLETVAEVSPEALLANSMAELLGSSPEVVRIEDAAQQLAVSPRTLQRLAKKYVGLSPAALIRRRRLQEAADKVRTHPGLDLAGIAADLGYADQAHLANDFQRFLEFSPSSYRSTVNGPHP